MHASVTAWLDQVQLAGCARLCMKVEKLLGRVDATCAGNAAGTGCRPAYEQLMQPADSCNMRSGGVCAYAQTAQ